MIKRYPLSHSQKLLLLEQLYDIESTHLNIGGYLLIDGIINPVLWEKAVNLVCEENEILRTSFVRNDDGVYFQEVQESLNSAIIKDFSAEPEDDSICLEWIQQRFNVPFEIDGGKLYELGLLLTSSKSYFYSIYNHLIADGWSVALAAKKIITKYELLINEVSIMNEDNSTFIDDINKSKEYFCSSKYKIDRQYWRDKAKSVRDYSWDISYKKREKKVAKSSARELEISKDYYANIIEFCNKNNLITFHFFLAVFSLMLKLRTSSNKVLFNVRIQNRATKREKENLGSYSSIIPLSVDLENRNFLNIFESIRNELNRGYKHRKCCMEEFYPSVVVEGNIDLSGAIVVSYEPFDYNYTVGGFIAEALTLPSGSVAESVDVHIREFHKNNRVFISSYFDENLFDNVEPDIFIEQFNLIVKRIVIEGINNINQLLGITSLEKSILDKMNNTEKILLKDNLCSVLEDVLFSNPLAVAVICKGEKHFYKELYSEAYKVVGFLQSYGIRLGDRISVSMDYSFEMIVVMTGIILGGAVFVPISNKDPLQRRGRIVSDSQSKILITDKICDLSCKQFLIKDVLISKENIHQEKVFLDENADCYIVYTSGSTGEPKGVINTHKGSVNILEEWKEKYEIVGERFVLLQTSSFAHDVFIGNYLKTIATGGILVLPTEEERYDLGELSCLLSNNKVNVLDSTPSLILMLVDYIERNNIDDSSLKLIIVGSDICSLEDFKKLLSKYGERAVVVNSYGVSEAAIYTTDYLAKKVDELPMFGNLPIGKPFRNIKMYVLDDQLRQVSLGVEGELFIAGYGLAKGYTSIALTREKFINLDGIGRVYRTGDMARILSDGNIQFIGRKDFQIKIRGYRIEPGDIESCMESIDGISKAVI
ncbi:MAG: AMP-binding protein, partial [Candidatus Margulisbacteria bacterium]|nr:AMP-binding protein [Candidatus Margulisiibacteriota bacterium]